MSYEFYLIKFHEIEHKLGLSKQIVYAGKLGTILGDFEYLLCEIAKTSTKTYLN